MENYITWWYGRLAMVVAAGEIAEISGDTKKT